jgi:hypothetical protein
VALFATMGAAIERRLGRVPAEGTTTCNAEKDPLAFLEARMSAIIWGAS